LPILASTKRSSMPSPSSHLTRDLLPSNVSCGSSTVFARFFSKSTITPTRQTNGTRQGANACSSQSLMCCGDESRSSSPTFHQTTSAHPILFISMLRPYLTGHVYIHISAAGQSHHPRCPTHRTPNADLYNDLSDLLGWTSSPAFTII
jgi:hypothetical protein